MRRKRLRKRNIMIAIIVILLAAASYLLYNSWPPHCESTIARNVDNPDEENALAAAENFNYSTLSLYERFSGMVPETYLQPSSYVGETWANFVDSVVINYYQTRYDYMHAKGLDMSNPKQVDFTYQANVTKLSQLQMYNTPGGVSTYQNITYHWDNGTVVYFDRSNSTVFKTVGLSDMYFLNGSTYQKLAPVFDLNFTDCYFIEMQFKYSEYYGPWTAFDSQIRQTLILDKNYTPLVIAIAQSKGIA
jgi:hypothetical protein